MLQLGIKK